MKGVSPWLHSEEENIGISNQTGKYSGETRIIVTTNQNVLRRGEDFILRIRILAESDDLSGELFFRKLGDKKYSTDDLKNIGAIVFEIKLSPERIPDDFEYYIRVYDGKDTIVYHATAGSINHAVITL